MSMSDGVKGGGKNPNLFFRSLSRSSGFRDKENPRMRVSPYLLDDSMAAREQLEIVDTFDHGEK